MREKITVVFYNNGHFEVLVYFKGTKIFLEVSLSSFVEDFFNSFNASELIILDWLKSNVFSKFSSILSATTCLEELFNLITSLFLATAFKQQIVTIVLIIIFSLYFLFPLRIINYSNLPSIQWWVNPFFRFRVHSI